jgi:signal transduction histidine kinase
MEAVTFKEEEAGTPQTIRPLDPNPNPHDLLPDGAVLLLGADGTVLAHGASLPPPFPAGTSFAGQPVQQVGPPSLGNCLHRLFEDSQQRHRPCMAEIITGWEAHNPTSHVALSVRVSPHPQQPDLLFVTARNLTKDRDRVQDLLDVIEVLREQRDEWEATARVVAHDVRSSVSAMTGFVKLALHRPGRMSSHASHHLQQALEFGNRLFSLVEMMVDKARGRRHEPERIELGPFGLRLFTALRAAHQTEALTWCVDVADHAVRAPAPLLWDAVWNLLDNAMKYRREDRSLEVHLRAWREGPEVWTEIRDNGRGIAVGEEERVFQKGRRGTRTVDVEGTGLGLYSTRQLVEQCGGRAWAEPCPEGAVLRVALPAWEVCSTPEDPRVLFPCAVSGD